MSKKKKLSFLPDDIDDFKLNNSINTDKKKIYNNKYRTEQTNSTSIEGDVKSYSLLKKEYDIVVNLENHEGKVYLNDLYYDFKPPMMAKVYEFISETELIRNNVEFTLTSDGRLKKITNKEDIYNSWINFKDNKIKTIDFIKTLKTQNEDEYQKLIKEGDKQFSVSNANIESDYDKDLLYLVLFDKHLTQDIKSLPDEQSFFQSQLFPRVKIPIEIRYDIVNETEKTLEVRKVAEAVVSDEIIKEIEREYDEIHRPLIHYKFSSYKLTYRVRYEVDKVSRVISTAEMVIIEDVENNLQSLCRYKMKKIS